MIACVDVDYDDPGGPAGAHARAACVVLTGWDAEAPVAEYLRELDGVAAYVPGRFYARELPCVRAVLGLVREPIDLIIVDGYVVLDAAGKLGMGGHLFRALGERVPVVGVAKSPFAGAPAIALLRGDSHRPLYVTTLGLDPSDAAARVRAMPGRFRLPTALKRVDRLCRDGR